MSMNCTCLNLNGNFRLACNLSSILLDRVGKEGELIIFLAESQAGLRRMYAKLIRFSKGPCDTLTV